MIEPLHTVNGTARLYLGDCVEVMRGLPDDSVDAVVTSPPYAMQRASTYGGVPEAEYPAWTVEWMAQVRRLLKSCGSVLINIREHLRRGEMSDYVHRTRLALREDGWIEVDELIWDKRNTGFPAGAPTHPRRTWERILWFSQGRRRYSDPKANGSEWRVKPHGAAPVGLADRDTGRLGRDAGKVVRARCSDMARFTVAQAEDPHASRHPARFPLGLAAWMIRFACPTGGVVLDPFMGSGSTGAACALEGRQFIGIEREPEYMEIARRRIAHWAGQPVVESHQPMAESHHEPAAPPEWDGEQATVWSALSAGV